MIWLTRWFVTALKLTLRFTDMFSLFKRDPARRLEQAYARKVNEAFQAQQNGNVRKYSLLTAEAEAIKEQISSVREGSK